MKQKAKKHYILEHVNPCQEDDFYEEIRIIGIFSSKKKAKDALKQVSEKKGFADCLGDFEKDSKGFYIGQYEVGVNGWQEGFIDNEF